MGQQSSLTIKSLYAHSLGLHHYSINSLSYLRTIQDKYNALYRELIAQLWIYASAIRILAKGYLLNMLVTPSKLQEILKNVKIVLQAANLEYDQVIDRLHSYYNMPLVTFGTERDQKLIIPFPVFEQPYTQQPLILYQLQTVPVPITDQNTQAHSYTQLQIDKSYTALNSDLHLHMTTGIGSLQKNWL